MAPLSIRQTSKWTSKRRMSFEQLESRSLLAADGFIGIRHNLLNPSDVNMDGVASPIDALAVIDELNRSKSTLESNSKMMMDTNNDGFVSPVDALVVIDTLNSEFVSRLPKLSFGSGGGGGSGEGTGGDVIAVDDYQAVYVSLDATAKPEIEVDVLMNDIGQGLRIADVGMAATGVVSIRPSTSNPNNFVLVYTPNAASANYDRFMYMIESSDGRMSAAYVTVQYELAQGPSTDFRLIMPEVVQGPAGQELNFRNPDSTPSVQITYSGFPGAMVGLYMRWEFVEGYSLGERFVGQILSRSTTDMATLYPISSGNAWIYGDVAGVNRILANLYFKPADGYSSAAGVRLDAWAFLSNSIGVSAGSTNASTLVKTIKPSSNTHPEAVDDYFASISRSELVELDVLANDDLKAFASNPSALTVDITPSPSSDAVIRWDPLKKKVLYQAGYNGLFRLREGDQFAYTIRTPDGQATQAVAMVIFR